MKLHLPKGLRSAVLACFAVVSGFVPTVGTGVIVGGTMTAAFVAPQAQADYTWIGGTGNKTATDWHNSANWNIGDATFAGSGPGTPNSNMWQTITVDGAVTFGSETDRALLLEGWNPKFNLNNGATVYGAIQKFQGTTVINVNNGSHLNLVHNNGHFEASTVNIGANSSFTLKLTGEKDNGAMAVNLNAPTAAMNFTADSALTLSGPIIIKTELKDIVGGTMVSQAIGLTAQNVTLSNVSIDIGEGWTRTESEITEENYQDFGGYYNLKVDANGQYYVVCSSVCKWTGGDLTWGRDTAFSNGTHTPGVAVNFTTADATVTLTSDVTAGTVSVADGIVVSISGEYALSTKTISVGAGATLRLATTGNSNRELELGSLATLSLAPGKEATLAAVLGAATISGANTAMIEVSGEGTYLTGVGNKFDSYAVISVTDGAKLNADGANWAGEGKQIIISEGATVQRTTGDDLFGWSSSQNISILTGGTLDLGATRATMDKNDVISLDGGTIVGTTTDYRGSLDFYQGGCTITATNGSVISAAIGTQKSDTPVVFDVTADAADAPGLTISGVLKNSLSFRKTGSGTLLLTAANTYNGTATVEEGTLMIDGEGSVGRNIHLLEGATLALGSGVTLQGENILEGEISITEAITLAGALTLGENAILNLDNWTGDSSYQLFTIAENGSITPQAVTIKGQSDTWLLNTSGALIQSSELHWLGGDLTWAADTEFSGGTYNPSAMIIFDDSKGDVNANVTEAISAQIITIESGTNLIVSGEGSLTTGRLTLDGTLTLIDTEFTAASVQAGADATLVLDGGSEKQWQMSDLPQTGTNKVEMAVTVASGSLYLTSESQTMGDIIVEDGAGLRLGGNASIGTLTLNGNGGWTSDGEVINAALLRNNGYRDFFVNNVNIATDSTVQVDGDYMIVVNGILSGEVLTKTGSGTLRLDGDVTNAGIIINGGTVRWGGNSSDGGTNALACESITINAGGTFQINHSSTDCGNVGIFLNGGRLYMEDQSQNQGSTFKSLTVQADSSIEYKYNGALNFGKLTGAGNLAITGDNEVGGAGFNTVVDYHGTITNTTTREITIGAVSQAADNILTLDCDVTLQNFSKTGEGSMIVTGAATLKGILSMNYEGSLDLGSAVALDNNLLLSYTDATKSVISLGQLTSAINIDLFALSTDDLASGINLGIADTTDASMLQVAGLKADEYTLTSVDGNWFLQTTTALHTDWDMNWGAAGIAGAPDTLPEIEIPADATAVALGGSGSLTGGTANAMVYGGAIEAPFTGDTWINVSEGTYLAIVGGTNANNWGSGTRADFNGDSHIVIDGATVGYIIGGIHKDGQGAQFNGSSYISVFSGDVTGAIIGSGTAAHNNSAVQNGDTNIFIYTALNTNTGSLPSGDQMPVPNDMVIGGYAWGRNISKGQTINGNTNITIDLSSYSGTAATFGKHIVGGHFNNLASTQTVTGSTNITIDLAGLSMADGRKIVGGNWSDQGNTNIGSTNITIKNGTFGEILGGAYSADSNSSHTIGATNITIDNGTFNGAIYAGNYFVAGGSSTVGESTVTINGGTFNQMIIGGSYVDHGHIVLNMGDTNITINGGTLEGDLIGGHYVDGNADANLSASTGDTNITLTGGKVGTVYGGSYCVRNNAEGVVNQGNITVDLQGGEVAGDIYAAGYQDGISSISSSSTTVKLDAGVAFVGDEQVVSGGYQSTAGTSTVTGDRTLAFTGTQDRSGVIFADFDTVNVSGSDNVTTSALISDAAVTKAGTGTLTNKGILSADSVTVTEGILVNTGTITHAEAAVMSADTDDDELTSVGLITIATGQMMNYGAVELDMLVDGGTLTLGANSIMAGVEINSGSMIVEGAVTATGALTLNGGTVTFMEDAVITLTDGAEVAIEGASIVVKLSDASLDSLVNGGTYTLFNTSSDMAGIDGSTMTFVGESGERVTAIVSHAGAGDLKIAALVPEPTTATLSLLALAGLAARRRRK